MREEIEGVNRRRLLVLLLLWALPMHLGVFGEETGPPPAPQEQEPEGFYIPPPIEPLPSLEPSFDFTGSDREIRKKNLLGLGISSAGVAIGVGYSVFQVYSLFSNASKGFGDPQNQEHIVSLGQGMLFAGITGVLLDFFLDRLLSKDPSSSG